MSYIAPWFRFTEAEIGVAFQAMEMSAEEAAAAARAFAIETAALDPTEGFGMAELGDWLGPVVALSEDAAARVAEHRARWGAPQHVFELEWQDGVTPSEFFRDLEKTSQLINAVGSQFSGFTSCHVEAGAAVVHVQSPEEQTRLHAALVQIGVPSELLQYVLKGTE